ncbi:unnamed protein product [Moneuplotes crassus]|uniref:Uncharacterized protein n=1 Tax=Euplotes crassus TaxID=5936 RepID=A0AAD1U0H0_EUPCR|nr:unnamed protein product [Moneuplotes crassus]
MEIYRCFKRMECQTPTCANKAEYYCKGDKALQCENCKLSHDFACKMISLKEFDQVLIAIDETKAWLTILRKVKQLGCISSRQKRIDEEIKSFETLLEGLEDDYDAAQQASNYSKTNNFRMRISEIKNDIRGNELISNMVFDFFMKDMLEVIKIPGITTSGGDILKGLPVPSKMNALIKRASEAETDIKHSKLAKENLDLVTEKEEMLRTIQLMKMKIDTLENRNQTLEKKYNMPSSTRNSTHTTTTFHSSHRDTITFDQSPYAQTMLEEEESKRDYEEEKDIEEEQDEEEDVEEYEEVDPSIYDRRNGSLVIDCNNKDCKHFMEKMISNDLKMNNLKNFKIDNIENDSKTLKKFIKKCSPEIIKMLIFNYDEDLSDEKPEDRELINTHYYLNSFKTLLPLATKMILLNRLIIGDKELRGIMQESSSCKTLTFFFCSMNITDSLYFMEMEDFKTSTINFQGCTSEDGSVNFSYIFAAIKATSLKDSLKRMNLNYCGVEESTIMDEIKDHGLEDISLKITS